MSGFWMMKDFKTGEAIYALKDTIDEEYSRCIKRYDNGSDYIRKRVYNQKLWKIWKAEDDKEYIFQEESLYLGVLLSRARQATPSLAVELLLN